MHSSNDPRNQVIDSGDMASSKSAPGPRGLQRQSTLANPPARQRKTEREGKLILPWNVAFFSQLERVIRKWPWEPWEWGRQTPFTQSRRR